MLKNILLLVMCCSLSACGTIFNSSVNGFADPTFDRLAKHTIVPLGDIQRGDLQFLEASTELSRAMTGAGLTLAGPNERPDVGVFMDYGIGAPRTETAVLSLPIYGQTGVSSATTTGTAVRYGAMTTVNATTTYTPTYGVVGQNNIPITSTVYDRFLTIRAFDLAGFARDKTVRELWKMDVRSLGSTGDLRTVLPFMLRSAQPYLGRSTGRAIATAYPGDDAQVEFIRTGVVPSRR